MKRRDGEDGQPITAVPPAKDVASLKILNALGSLEWFTPRVLVNDTHLTNRANHSAKDRSIAHLIVAVFLISLVAVAGQCYTYYQIAPTGELKSTVLALYGFAYLCALLALISFKYVHRSASKLSNSYAGFTLVLTLGIHTLTGLTLNSPVVPLYFFIPAWAFLTCSSRSGIGWSLVIASVFIGVTVIEPMQFAFPNIIPAEKLAIYQLASGLSALLLLGICLHSHQNSFLALTDQLDEDRLLYAHKAQHDPLTGLANREQFDLQLQQALDDANWNHKYAALIYIDLNDFKAINDTHGHQVGDAVLKISARRIAKLVRENDTTARLGGDEFGIVLPQLEDKDAVTRIVTELEESLAQPIGIGDIFLTISGSVGLATAPDDGRTASSLTRHADRNMYDAKSAKTRLKLVQAV